EYELLATLWKRLSTKQQLDTPFDSSLMQKLARDVLLGRPYPWTWNRLSELGIDDTAFRRLENCGWLRRTIDERVEGAPDRLLNWAVAQSLFDSIRGQDRTIDDVVAEVAEINRGNTPSGLPFLGYVPMDFLWLIAGDTKFGRPVGAQLLAALEPTCRHD